MAAMTRPTVLIAGGGLAGLATAVALDEQGFAVTILEQKPQLGGRTFSFVDKKTGHVVDNGQHLMIGAYRETLSYLEKIGAKHGVAYQTPTVVPLVTERGRRGYFRLNAWQAPWGLLRALLGFSGFSLKEKVAFARLGVALQKMRSGRESLPSEQTVAGWLQGLGQGPRALRNFLEVLTLATLNDALDTVSADLLATVLLKSYFADPLSGQLVFFKKGLSEVFVEPALKYLEARGQTVRAGVGVREIKVLNGRVQGFALSDDTVAKADYYVSALPFHRLLGVLPQPFIETTPSLKHLREFTHSPIVSINLFFDAPVMDEIFVGSAATRVHWFFDRGRWQEQSLPTWHVMGVVSAGYDFLDKDKDEIVRLAHADLIKIFPAASKARLVHALVNIERQATLSCRVGVGPKRPQHKVLENFWIAGDWTRTGLPPTIESAVVSGRLVAEDVQACLPKSER